MQTHANSLNTPPSLSIAFFLRDIGLLGVSFRMEKGQKFSTHTVRHQGNQEN